MRARSIGYDTNRMNVVSAIIAAVIGIVLTVVWLLVLMAMLTAAVWIVAEIFSLMAGAVGRRERAGW